MKTLKRNESPLWYCLYSGKTELVDEYGNSTGQYALSYGQPTQMYANISPATGHSSTEIFGSLENYDKVIVTAWLDCPINENSVLFIDKAPDMTSVPTYELTEIPTYVPFFVEVSASSVSVPTPDYIVRGVAKSKNFISIAVKKVKVS